MENQGTTVYKAVMLRAPDGRQMPKDFYLYSTREDFVLTSLAVGSGARVIYSIGTRVCAPDWLKEQGYHLIAYATKRSAVDFIKACDTEGCCVVFEAFAFDVVFPLPKRAHIDSLYPGHDMKFPRTNEPQLRWPSDTIMAQELQLLRCVWSIFPYPPLGITCTEWSGGSRR